MHNISDFLIDAASVDADLVIVATTRPQGYSSEFDQYRHLTLRSLEPNEALHYASRLAAVRHSGDPDTEESVLARVKAAAKDPTTSRLMRTPLQVTIMSLLLERRNRVPQDRYGLFDAYYATIYDREIAKGGARAALLEEQRVNINAVHERVGLLLETRAEHAGEADSLLSLAAFRKLTTDRLTEEGYQMAEAEDLAHQLMQVATDRLVLLVPRTVQDIGFEIRSLQEFMAARALVSGTEDEIIARLRPLAPSPHWRNTWLFAAGSLFKHHEHMRYAIIAILTDIDSTDRLAALLAPGAQLAMDLLSDNVAVQAPRYRRLLVQRALSLIELLPGPEIYRLAEVLRDCDQDITIHSTIDLALERAMNSKGRPAISAFQLLQACGPHSRLMGARLERESALLTEDQRRAIGAITVLYPRNPQLASAMAGGITSDWIIDAISRKAQIEYTPAIRARLNEILALMQKPRSELTNAGLEEDDLMLIAQIAETLPFEHWPAAAWLRDFLAQRYLMRSTLHRSRPE
jgi:hypothetical protein